MVDLTYLLFCQFRDLVLYAYYNTGLCSFLGLWAFCHLSWEGIRGEAE